MGHFFFPCRLSNTPIIENVEAYLFPLRKDKNSNWVIGSLPSIVTVDSYGRIEEVVFKNGIVPEDSILDSDCVLINRQVLDSCVVSQNDCGNVYSSLKDVYSKAFNECEEALKENNEKIAEEEKRENWDPRLRKFLEVNLSYKCESLRSMEMFLRWGRVKFHESDDNSFYYGGYCLETREFFWKTFVPTLKILRLLNVNMVPYKEMETLQESWIYESSPVLSTLLEETKKVIESQKNIWCVK